MTLKRSLLMMIPLVFSAWLANAAHGALAPPRELPLFTADDLTPFWPDELAHGEVTPVAAVLPPFRLTDQDGHSVTERDFDGGVSVVNFFFTGCGSSCPLMMRRLRSFQAAMHANGVRIRLFSFSVTPRKDSPQVLKTYASGRNLDLSDWRLLTGARDAVYRLGRDVLKADRSLAGDKSFIHSNSIYLFDARRRLRGIYESTDDAQMRNLAEDIRRLQR